MKTAILIHGMPTEKEYFDPKAKAQSNTHWFPWLQHQLLINGIFAQTPEMPAPYKPRYEAWKKVFEQFPIGEETVLVGHSCGGGFLVRWLSETQQAVGKVILVAPWIDPGHVERHDVGDFFDFEIDSSMVAQTKGITAYVSNDDEEPMRKTVEILEAHVPGIEIVRFEDKGHFTETELGTDAFPELLEVILKNK